MNKEYSKSQKKIVATAHTALSLAVIIALVAAVAWIILKSITFAAQAVIPVAVGFFLALFFKPYYLLLKKKLRYPAVALIVMLLSVFVPIGTALWWSGAVIVDEVSGLAHQIPQTITRAADWIGSRSSHAQVLLSQLNVPSIKVNMHSAQRIEGMSLPKEGVCSNLVVRVVEGYEKTKDVISAEIVDREGAVASNGFSIPAVGCAGARDKKIEVGDFVDTNLNAKIFGLLGDGARIDVERLKEIYSKYGDQIKKAGAGFAQSAKSKLSEATVAASREVAPDTGIGSNFMNKIGFAFASGCRIARKFCMSAIFAFSGALYILVTCIFFVYFLMSDNLRGGKIVEFIPMLKDSTRRFIVDQIDSFIRILVSFYQRQVVICIIERFLYGLGFWVVGLPYGFVVGFMLGCLNLVPFFGSLVCMPLAVALGYFGAGESGFQVLLVLIVWIIGQILDGYYITPKIQGDKTGIGYAGVIFSFLFWPIVLGPMLGLLLAIPLSACCVVLWRGFCDFTKHKKVF